MESNPQTLTPQVENIQTEQKEETTNEMMMKKKPHPESPLSPLSKAIVPVPVITTSVSKFSPPSPPPRQEKLNSPSPSPSPTDSPPEVVLNINRAVKEDVGNNGGPGSSGFKGLGSDGGERRKGNGGRSSVGAILKRSQKEKSLKKVALGFRVCEVILCLVSFSVMAADRTQGWSGDSFDRYKEYRFCLSVTVIAFAYSGFQAFNSAYHLITEKYLIQHHLRNNFDFIMDQILAYLLISASSSAATRVDDWQSNWGKDEFTEMASASVSMAILAFIAFAMSSLISGYNLCIGDS